MDLDAEKLYHLAWMAALSDGKLHPGESAVLGHLREALGLSEDDAHKLYESAKQEHEKGERDHEGLDAEELYRTACRLALEDGVLDYGEAHCLIGLADALDLSTERSTELLEGIELEVQAPEVRIGEPLEAFEGEALGE